MRFPVCMRIGGLRQRCDLKSIECVVEGFGEAMSDEYTRRLCMGRLEAARAAKPQADFWIGTQAGLEWRSKHEIWASWYIAIRERSCQTLGMSRTASFVLPEKLGLELLHGVDVATATAQCWHTPLKAAEKWGLSGLLTFKRLPVRDLLAQGCLLALVPFFEQGSLRQDVRWYV